MAWGRRRWHLLVRRPWRRLLSVLVQWSGGLVVRAQAIKEVGHALDLGMSKVRHATGRDQRRAFDALRRVYEVWKLCPWAWERDP